MAILVKIIGTCIACAGIMIILNPRIARRMMAFWRQGKHIYAGGLIRILLGAGFLYYTPQSRLPQVMFMLGILALLGGLFIFIVGLEKTRVILDWWDKKPEHFLRLLSLFVIAFGALIIYAA